MEITRVDAEDADAVRCFHEIYTAVGFADAPETFVPSPVAEIVSVLRRPTTRFAFTAFLGHDQGRPVASGWCARFLTENLGHMFVLPRVTPTERRRGYGSEMLAALEGHARSVGVHGLEVQSRWPSTFGARGAGSPTGEFARRHHFDLGLVEIIRRLDLPLDPAREAELAADVAAHAGAYAIHAWVGPVPDAYLDGWAILDAAISTDAPQGDLGRDAQTPDPAAVRDEERVQAESGLTTVGAVAVARGGEVVAYTDMVIQLDHPEPARQGGTLVAAAHRGQRLGLAVKLAAVDRLRCERPDVPATLTQNAADNTAMIAINERLGYRAIEHIGIFQKHLGPAPARR